MSIQRIDNDRKRMHGWQARAYLEAPERCRPRRLTRWLSDRAHGGKWKARQAAEVAEANLLRQARALRTGA